MASVYILPSYHLKKWAKKSILVHKEKKKDRKWNLKTTCMIGTAFLSITINLIWSQLLVYSVKIMRIYLNLSLIKNYPFSMTLFLNIVSLLTITFPFFFFILLKFILVYQKMLNWNYILYSNTSLVIYYPNKSDYTLNISDFQNKNS